MLIFQVGEWALEQRRQIQSIQVSSTSFPLLWRWWNWWQRWLISYHINAIWFTLPIIGNVCIFFQWPNSMCKNRIFFYTWIQGKKKVEIKIIYYITWMKIITMFKIKTDQDVSFILNFDLIEKTCNSNHNCTIQTEP